MNIKKNNIEKIQNVFKTNKTVVNSILNDLYKYYQDEVGIETILRFLTKEDGMNFRIQNGIHEPGITKFDREPPEDIPGESEIEKIIIKNKIPYKESEIKGRLIQYFLRRLVANIPSDKEFNSDDEVIDFLKTYETAFLYGYLIPMAEQLKENFMRKIIKEALATAHAKSQFQDRFLSNRTMSVGLEIGMGIYDEVGTYQISDTIISELEKRFKILTQKSFPKNKSYAVKIMDIPINPNEINYYSPELKHSYQNKQKYKNPFVLLNDSSHDSNGNCVYVIIRYGETITTMLAKNYVKISPDKMNVDFIIKDWDLIVQNKVR